MLKWDKNVIEYLDRAEKYSKYAEQIVSKIKPYLGKCEKALEVGCGIGNISIELSKIYKNVTSIDISKEVIVNLKKKIKSDNIENIDAKVLSSSDDINEKYDLIFTSFFFEQDDFIRMIKKNLREDGVGIFILRKNMQHTIRNNIKSMKNSSYDSFEKKLIKENITFKKSEAAFYRGQPFVDDEDIKRFCKLYDSDYDVYKKNVKELSDNKYKYVYEVKREVYIYSIDKVCT